jgi:ribosomal protein S27AE
MASDSSVERRRMFCVRCGQMMFEFYRSPDGHFGIVREVQREDLSGSKAILCPTCGARYRLLERVNSMGVPVERA